MPSIPVQRVVDQWGNLTTAEEGGYGPRYFCFHCGCLMRFIYASQEQPAHFIHDPAHLTAIAALACPGLHKHDS